MADPKFLCWLESTEWPGDLYELLGRQRFHPSIHAMQEEVKSAARELIQFQNHSNPKTAQRAMRLLNEHVGRAAGVLVDPAKLAQEQQDVCMSLRSQFADRHGEESARWDKGELKNWLVKEGNVHPAAVALAVSALLPTAETAKRRSSVFKPHNHPLPDTNAELAETTTITIDDSHDELAWSSSAEVLDDQTEQTCPICTEPVSLDSVLCTNCGYSLLPKKQQRATQVLPRRKTVRRQSSKWPILAAIATAVGVPLVVLIAVFVSVLGESGSDDKSHWRTEFLGEQKAEFKEPQADELKAVTGESPTIPPPYRLEDGKPLQDWHGDGPTVPPPRRPSQPRGPVDF